jgi:hypothetical protein
MAEGDIWKPLVMARMVYPTIPERLREQSQLEDDLSEIGCVDLFLRPWTLKNGRIIEELIVGASNQYELTMRGRPGTWTDEVWAKVYGFSKKGFGLASRTDKFAVGKFRNAAHSKEGYAINDCLDGR